MLERMKILFLAVSAAACGGATASSARDGGNDGGPPDDGGAGDVSPGAPDAEVASLSKFCMEVEAYAARCSTTLDPCDQSIAAACPGVFDVYRSEYLEAIAACGLPTQCVPTGIETSAAPPSNAIEQSCTAKAIGAIAPTSAQEKLAVDLCQACGGLPGESSCPGSDFFFLGGPTDGGGAVVSGPGVTFIFLEDSLVNAIESSCLEESVLGPPSGTDCWSNFYACVDKQQSAKQPPAFVSACQVQQGM
jgi:hypothetical protein